MKHALAVQGNSRREHTFARDIKPGRLRKDKVGGEFMSKLVWKS